MARCLIGLGANLDRPQQMVQQALQRLDDAPQMRVVSQSRLIFSRAVGPAGQDEYCNAAAQIETSLGPGELLQALLNIEAALGRRRTAGDPRWGPRLIDLDLLLFEELVIYASELTVPHPWLLVRRFALGPAAEAAPDMTHPMVGRPLTELWDACQGPVISICGDDGPLRRSVAAAAAAAIEKLPDGEVALADDPCPQAADGEAWDERQAALPSALPPRSIVLAPFLVSAPQPSTRAIVLLESPVAVYSGRRSTSAQAAMDAARPLLVSDPRAETAVSDVVHAWMGLRD